MASDVGSAGDEKGEFMKRRDVVRVLKDVGITTSRTSRVVSKVLRAIECGWVCPFTGKPISMRSLLNGEVTLTRAQR